MADDDLLLTNNYNSTDYNNSALSDKNTFGKLINAKEYNKQNYDENSPDFSKTQIMSDTGLSINEDSVAFEQYIKFAQMDKRKKTKKTILNIDSRNRIKTYTYQTSDLIIGNDRPLQFIKNNNQFTIDLSSNNYIKDIYASTQIILSNLDENEFNNLGIDREMFQFNPDTGKYSFTVRRFMYGTLDANFDKSKDAYNFNKIILDIPSNINTGSIQTCSIGTNIEIKIIFNINNPYPTSSHYRVDLGNTFSNIYSIRLISTELPNSSYTFNDNLIESNIGEFKLKTKINNKLRWINKSDYIQDYNIDLYNDWGEYSQPSNPILTSISELCNAPEDSAAHSTKIENCRRLFSIIRCSQLVNNTNSQIPLTKRDYYKKLEANVIQIGDNNKLYIEDIPNLVIEESLLYSIRKKYKLFTHYITNKTKITFSTNNIRITGNLPDFSLTPFKIIFYSVTGEIFHKCTYYVTEINTNTLSVIPIHTTSNPFDNYDDNNDIMITICDSFSNEDIIKWQKYSPSTYHLFKSYYFISENYLTNIPHAQSINYTIRSNYDTIDSSGIVLEYTNKKVYKFINNYQLSSKDHSNRVQLFNPSAKVISVSGNIYYTESPHNFVVSDIITVSGYKYTVSEVVNNKQFELNEKLGYDSLHDVIFYNNSSIKIHHTDFEQNRLENFIETLTKYNYFKINTNFYKRKQNTRIELNDNYYTIKLDNSWNNLVDNINSNIVLEVQHNINTELKYMYTTSNVLSNTIVRLNKTIDNYIDVYAGTAISINNTFKYPIIFKYAPNVHDDFTSINDISVSQYNEVSRITLRESTDLYTVTDVCVLNYPGGNSNKIRKCYSVSGGTIIYDPSYHIVEQYEKIMHTNTFQSDLLDINSHNLLYISKTSYTQGINSIHSAKEYVELNETNNIIMYSKNNNTTNKLSGSISIKNYKDNTGKNITKTKNTRYPVYELNILSSKYTVDLIVKYMLNALNNLKSRTYDYSKKTFYTDTTFHKFIDLNNEFGINQESKFLISTNKNVHSITLKQYKKVFDSHKNTAVVKGKIIYYNEGFPYIYYNIPQISIPNNSLVYMFGAGNIANLGEDIAKGEKNVLIPNNYKIKMRQLLPLPKIDAINNNQTLFAKEGFKDDVEEELYNKYTDFINQSINKDHTKDLSIDFIIKKIFGIGESNYADTNDLTDEKFKNMTSDFNENSISVNHTNIIDGNLKQTFVNNNGINEYYNQSAGFNNENRFASTANSSGIEYYGQSLINGFRNKQSYSEYNDPLDNTGLDDINIYGDKTNSGFECAFIQNELFMRLSDIQKTHNENTLGRITNLSEQTDRYGNIEIDFDLFSEKNTNFSIGDIIIGLDSNAIGIILPDDYEYNGIPSQDLISIGLGAYLMNKSVLDTGVFFEKYYSITDTALYTRDLAKDFIYKLNTWTIERNYTNKGFYVFSNISPNKSKLSGETLTKFSLYQPKFFKFIEGDDTALEKFGFVDYNNNNSWNYFKTNYVASHKVSIKRSLLYITNDKNISTEYLIFETKSTGDFKVNDRVYFENHNITSTKGNFTREHFFNIELLESYSAFISKLEAIYNNSILNYNGLNGIGQIDVSNKRDNKYLIDKEYKYTTAPSNNCAIANVILDVSLNKIKVNSGGTGYVGIPEIIIDNSANKDNSMNKDKAYVVSIQKGAIQSIHTDISNSQKYSDIPVITTSPTSETAIVKPIQLGSEIFGMHIINPGSGYTSSPEITIAPSGITATASVKVAGIGTITIKNSVNIETLRNNISRNIGNSELKVSVYHPEDNNDNTNDPDDFAYGTMNYDTLNIDILYSGSKYKYDGGVNKLYVHTDTKGLDITPYYDIFIDAVSEIEINNQGTLYPTGDNNQHLAPTAIITDSHPTSPGTGAVVSVGIATTAGDEFDTGSLPVNQTRVLYGGKGYHQNSTTITFSPPGAIASSTLQKGILSVPICGIYSLASYELVTNDIPTIQNITITIDLSNNIHEGIFKHAIIEPILGKSVKNGLSYNTNIDFAVVDPGQGYKDVSITFEYSNDISHDLNKVYINRIDDISNIKSIDISSSENIYKNAIFTTDRSQVIVSYPGEYSIAPVVTITTENQTKYDCSSWIGNTGKISNITMHNTGGNYTSNPLLTSTGLTFAETTIREPKINAQLDDMIITNTGHGYTDTPSITINTNTNTLLDNKQNALICKNNISTRKYGVPLIGRGQIIKIENIRSKFIELDSTIVNISNNISIEVSGGDLLPHGITAQATPVIEYVKHPDRKGAIYIKDIDITHRGYGYMSPPTLKFKNNSEISADASFNEDIVGKHNYNIYKRQHMLFIGSHELNNDPPQNNDVSTTVITIDNWNNTEYAKITHKYENMPGASRMLDGWSIRKVVQDLSTRYQDTVTVHDIMDEEHMSTVMLLQSGNLLDVSDTVRVLPNIYIDNNGEVLNIQNIEGENSNNRNDYIYTISDSDTKVSYSNISPLLINGEINTDDIWEKPANIDTKFDISTFQIAINQYSDINISVNDVDIGNVVDISTYNKDGGNNTIQLLSNKDHQFSNDKIPVILSGEGVVPKYFSSGWNKEDVPGNSTYFAIIGKNSKTILIYTTVNDVHYPVIFTKDTPNLNINISAVKTIVDNFNEFIYKIHISNGSIKEEETNAFIKQEITDNNVTIDIEEAALQSKLQAEITGKIQSIDIINKGYGYTNDVSVKIDNIEYDASIQLSNTKIKSISVDIDVSYNNIPIIEIPEPPTSVSHSIPFKNKYIYRYFHQDVTNYDHKYYLTYSNSATDSTKFKISYNSGNVTNLHINNLDILLQYDSPNDLQLLTIEDTSGEKFIFYKDLLNPSPVKYIPQGTQFNENTLEVNKKYYIYLKSYRIPVAVDKLLQLSDKSYHIDKYSTLGFLERIIDDQMNNIYNSMYYNIIKAGDLYKRYSYNIYQNRIIKLKVCPIDDKGFSYEPVYTENNMAATETDVAHRTVKGYYKKLFPYHERDIIKTYEHSKFGENIEIKNVPYKSYRRVRQPLTNTEYSAKLFLPGMGVYLLSSETAHSGYRNNNVHYNKATISKDIRLHYSEYAYKTKFIGYVVGTSIKGIQHYNRNYRLNSHQFSKQENSIHGEYYIYMLIDPEITKISQLDDLFDDLNKDYNHIVFDATANTDYSVVPIKDKGYLSSKNKYYVDSTTNTLLTRSDDVQYLIKQNIYDHVSFLNEDDESIFFEDEDYSKTITPDKIDAFIGLSASSIKIHKSKLNKTLPYYSFQTRIACATITERPVCYEKRTKTSRKLFLSADYDYFYRDYLENKTVMRYKRLLDTKNIDHMNRNNMIINNPKSLNHKTNYKETNCHSGYLDPNISDIPGFYNKPSAETMQYETINGNQPVGKLNNGEDIIIVDGYKSKFVYSEGDVDYSTIQGREPTKLGIRNRHVNVLVGSLLPSLYFEHTRLYDNNLNSYIQNCCLLDYEYSSELERLTYNRMLGKYKPSKLDIVGNNSIEYSGDDDDDSVLYTRVDIKSINLNGTITLGTQLNKDKYKECLFIVNTNIKCNNKSLPVDPTNNCEMSIIDDIDGYQITLRKKLNINDNPGYGYILYPTNTLSEQISYKGVENKYEIKFHSTTRNTPNNGDYILIDWGKYTMGVYRVDIVDNAYFIYNPRYEYLAGALIFILKLNDKSNICSNFMSTQPFTKNNEWYTRIFYKGFIANKGEHYNHLYEKSYILPNIEFMGGEPAFNTNHANTIYIGGMKGIKMPFMDISTHTTSEMYSMPVDDNYYETEPSIQDDYLVDKQFPMIHKIHGKFTNTEIIPSNNYIWKDDVSSNSIEYPFIIIKGFYMGYGGFIEERCNRDTINTILCKDTSLPIKKITSTDDNKLYIYIQFPYGYNNVLNNNTIYNNNIGNQSSRISKKNDIDLTHLDSIFSSYIDEYEDQLHVFGTGGDIIRKKINTPYDLNPDNYIYMVIPNLNHIQSCQSEINKEAFAKILIPGESSNVLFNSFIAGTKIFNSNLFNNLSELEITFMTNDGYLFDFNGSEHSFSIEITEIIDKFEYINPRFGNIEI